MLSASLSPQGTRPPPKKAGASNNNRKAVPAPVARSAPAVKVPKTAPKVAPVVNSRAKSSVSAPKRTGSQTLLNSPSFQKRSGLRLPKPLPDLDLNPARHASNLIREGNDIIDDGYHEVVKPLTRGLVKTTSKLILLPAKPLLRATNTESLAEELVDNALDAGSAVGDAVVKTKNSLVKYNADALDTGAEYLDDGADALQNAADRGTRFIGGVAQRAADRFNGAGQEYARRASRNFQRGAREFVGYDEDDYSEPSYQRRGSSRTPVRERGGYHHRLEHEHHRRPQSRAAVQGRGYRHADSRQSPTRRRQPVVEESTDEEEVEPAEEDPSEEEESDDGNASFDEESE